MFGLHINPETPRVDAATLLNYLRAFVLLYPCLEQRIKVDITRRLGPYINSFPDEYVRLILAEDYPATAERLIDDYVRFNPTRNRPLDMLPVLACLDRERTLSGGRGPSPDQAAAGVSLSDAQFAAGRAGLARRGRVEYVGHCRASGE